MYRAWFIGFVLVATAFSVPLFATAPAAAQAPSITIVSPKGITPVSTLGFQIQVAVSSDFILDQEHYGVGPDLPGHGHVHYYLDPNATSDGTLLGATWLTVLNVGALPAGAHKVRAELRNNTHGPLVPRVFNEITVTAVAPSITIVSPKVTAVSTLGFRIEVAVAGLDLDDANYGGTNVPGHGHIHYYRDPNATSSGALLAATTSTVFDIPALTAGTHIIRAELRQNNHAALSPAVLQNLTVTASAPSITIVSPKITTVPTLGFRIEVAVGGFILDEANYGGTKVAGQGHIHYYLDPATVNQLLAATTATAYDVGALSAGTHTIRAELRQNNHAALSPAVFSEITVTAAGPSITIVSPKVTSVPTLGVRVEVAVGGFILDQPNYGGTNVAGHGHIHYTIDGGGLIATTNTSAAFAPLSAGTHVIRAELRNNDHTPLSPAVFQEITVTAGAPSIRIIEPLASAAVSTLGFRVRVAVSGFFLDQPDYGGTNVPGQGHIHYTIDGGGLIATTDASMDFAAVSAGTHVIRAELRNNDHSALSPAVFQEVSVTTEVPGVTVKLSANTIEVGQPLVVSWTVTGFVMDSAAVNGAPEAGRGHVHIFVDNVYQNFSTGDTYVVSNLAQGSHTIKVGLFNNDHTGLTPAVESSATVHVVAQSALPSQAAPLYFGTVAGLIIVIAILAALLVMSARRRRKIPPEEMMPPPPK